MQVPRRPVQESHLRTHPDRFQTFLSLPSTPLPSPSPHTPIPTHHPPPSHPSTQPPNSEMQTQTQDAERRAAGGTEGNRFALPAGSTVSSPPPATGRYCAVHHYTTAQLQGPRLSPFGVPALTRRADHLLFSSGVLPHRARRSYHDRRSGQRRWRRRNPKPPPFPSLLLPKYVQVRMSLVAFFRNPLPRWALC